MFNRHLGISIQWIGLRDILQESPMIFMGKFLWFPGLRFSPYNQSIDPWTVSPSMAGYEERQGFG